MKTLIVSGGQPPSLELLNEELIDTDYIICADKGGEVLYKYGIEPDIILGDFDSIDKDTLNYYKEKHIIVDSFPSEKDFTDSYAALEKALAIGSDKIAFLGCTGNRLDHILGNLGLLYCCLDNGVDSYIKDGNNLIRLINKSCIIKPNGYNYFSLISYGTSVTGITLIGAKYPLNNYTLKLGECLGISNEFNEPQVEVQFKEGLLLLIQSKE
ncbi:thiamine diphosphokinase [Clostridium sp. MSJ-11]|uniref:Thiamine diphosphokinase n=1 Tax=Clostridium mobile TaxID=2841512 RepID=A0ABS6EC07_9CLOT|nr:thiamine diphosphokinase [Clostridium mobile]MBU5482734.1 thiamine diphosphokinase [Clostridium mobile]